MCRPSKTSPSFLAGKTYTSRLIVGTGKYQTYADNARALEASGAEIVTVAVRRVNLTDSQPAQARRFHRSEEGHLPAQHRRAASPARMPCAPCAWRARRAAGTSSSSKCWARRSCSIPTCSKRCARPRC
ncbi:MAG: hypothetical protein WDM81_15300 [Rhizomicrobium sp.]